jgi:dCMP deaminase
MLDNPTMTLGGVVFGPKNDLVGSPQRNYFGEWKGSATPQMSMPQIANVAMRNILGKYKRFVPVAEAFASMSKYPGTKVGCIILGEGHQVLSSGWNGAPRGSKADVDGRLADKPTRLSWACHAEANAIANAARSGTSLNGGTLICTLMPCMACAKSIVQSGIVRVLCPLPVGGSTWGEEFKLSKALFDECSVDLVYYDILGE